MWRDFDRVGAMAGLGGWAMAPAAQPAATGDVRGGATLAFSFPTSRPPEWRERWQAIVAQVAVTPTDDAKDALLDEFAGGIGVRTLGFVNAHAFNRAVSDPVFAKDILGLDHVVRDGIGVVALYRLIGSRAGLNLNGTDLLPELFARFAGQRIALFGTRLDLVDRVAAAMRRDLGCDVITADGFQSDGDYLRRVAQARPALVVLGMGMPKQERVAHAMKHGLNQDVAVVCGGAILDFLSGHKPRAPRWMRSAGLEWAFRLSLEPKRLFGRYVIGNPLFLLRSAILALWPRPAVARLRTLRERAPSAEPFGIGGSLASSQPPDGAGSPRASLKLVAAGGTALPQIGIAPSAAPLALAPLVSVATPGLAQPVPLLAAVDGALIGDSPPRVRSVPPLPHASAISVFSANRPVIARADLYGRHRELDRLLTWVLDQNGNALIYGPRGYGKTSLVRVFGEIADSRDQVVLYASCARGIDFDALMRGYLSEIAAAATAEVPGSGPLTVPEVALRLAALGKTPIVIIIDEFDRIERDDTRENIIELIKDVSDLTASVRFVLVGVATDASSILGYHPSIQRSLAFVPLARLEPDAIAAMFTAKARADGLTLAATEIAAVTALTAGSAYHAQLIGQKLVSEARRTGQSRIETTDLDGVIDDILREAVLMDDGFARLSRALRDPLARGRMLRLGRLALSGPDDVIDVTECDTALKDHCNELASDNILRAAGPDAAAGWRFTNAFLPQLLLMIDHRAARQRPREG